MTTRLPKLSSLGFSSLSFIFLSFLSYSASAQILNAGFEDTHPNGGPAHWAKILQVQFPCTVSQGYDSTYFQSLDAHHGKYAVEMRNAHCDDSHYFAGGVNLMQADEFYSGFGAPFTERPAAISFFYKLLPVGGDVGRITIELTDANGGQIAYTEFFVTQPATNYTSISIPIDYFTTDIPAFIGITMGIANQTTHVNYGTRFLVDDVSATTTGVNTIKGAKKALVIYPNPSQGTVIIKAVENTPVQLEVYNSTGQLVMNSQVPVNTTIDIQTLPAGLYTYRIISNTKLTGSGKLLRI